MPSGFFTNYQKSFVLLVPLVLSDTTHWKRKDFYFSMHGTTRTNNIFSLVPCLGKNKENNFKQLATRDKWDKQDKDKNTHANKFYFISTLFSAVIKICFSTITIFQFIAPLCLTRKMRAKSQRGFTLRRSRNNECATL